MKIIKNNESVLVLWGKIQSYKIVSKTNQEKESIHQ